MRLCKNCNQYYENTYLLKNTNYKYTVETNFCSKSCAAKYRVKEFSEPLTKETIEKEIIDFVNTQNSYCSYTEISKGIKRSSKTLSKFNINIVELQRDMGFIKPKSFFEQKVYENLKLIYNDIECEKSFDGLVSPKGYSLRVDFFIPSANLIIEADGSQHTDVKNPMYSYYCSECDNLKNLYAQEKNILIVRVPYSKKVTHQYIVKFLPSNI